LESLSRGMFYFSLDKGGGGRVVGSGMGRIKKTGLVKVGKGVSVSGGGVGGNGEGNDAQTPHLPKKHPGRRGYGIAGQDGFLRAFVADGLVKPTCQSLGIDHNTPYDWARKSPTFAKRFEQAKKQAERTLLDTYEAQIRKRSLMEKAPSDLLLMFVTKKLNPTYRDVMPASVAGPGAVNLQVNVFTGTSPARVETDEISR